MSLLPVILGRDAAKAFAKRGYLVDRQCGSHIILRHKNPPFRRLTIPDHKTIANLASPHSGGRSKRRRILGAALSPPIPKEI